MKLVRPNLSHEASAREFIKSFQDNPDDLYFLRELDRFIDCNYKAWLRYIEQIRLKYKFIQYFCIHNDKIIGMVEIRYPKYSWLVNQFGHIGYVVSPKYRGHGYAKCMLQIAAKIAVKLIKSPIIVTCDETNIASQRTIEANDGKLMKTFIGIEHGLLKRLYVVPQRGVKNAK